MDIRHLPHVAFLTSLSALDSFELDAEDNLTTHIVPIRSIERLLECIPQATTVVLPNDAPLQAPALEDIGRGESLPALEHFDFAALDADGVIPMLEMRAVASEGGHGGGAQSCAPFRTVSIRCPVELPEGVLNRLNSQWLNISQTVVQS